MPFISQTICTLFLYNSTKENVIAVARLLTDAVQQQQQQISANVSEAQNLQHLLRIKVSVKRDKKQTRKKKKRGWRLLS